MPDRHTVRAMGYLLYDAAAMSPILSVLVLLTWWRMRTWIRSEDHLTLKQSILDVNPVGLAIYATLYGLLALGVLLALVALGLVIMSRL